MYLGSASPYVKEYSATIPDTCILNFIFSIQQSCGSASPYVKEYSATIPDTCILNFLLYIFNSAKP